MISRIHKTTSGRCFAKRILEKILINGILVIEQNYRLFKKGVTVVIPTGILQTSLWIALLEENDFFKTDQGIRSRIAPEMNPRIILGNLLGTLIGFFITIP